MATQSQFYRRVIPLTSGVTSGVQQINIPFNARYCAVYNLSTVSAFATEGLQAAASPDAMQIQPMDSVAFEIRDSSGITITWQSSGAIPVPSVAQPQQITVLMSTEPINLAVGSMNSANPTNVVVANTVSSLTEIVSGGALVPMGDGTTYNGQTSAIARTVASLSGPGAGPWYDSYEAADGNNGVNMGQISNWAWNGASWDRVRVIPGATGVAATPYSGTQSVAITTATTTAVKGSPGVVGTLINAGGATSGAISIYDSATASGKMIWSGTLTAGQVLPLGMPCSTAITVVTAAANSLSLSYA